ncbi:sigma-54-dependent transcriptional regulator [Desulfoplanes formicivorans]|uniref:Sigma-54-dependent Fis family transcriptional regulator n=1 Tax=Desulfoplanes formicivorans TaxID=1592317 RepID=A0A194AGS0_9BACT|nr:sigma-54 dependent transcriptional regulator [Desulfoplanes formicivorans]GAU08523.1 sigma-54-dependent Fis family transcriptional regulator [Desulfoplanes formicivorans]
MTPAHILVVDDEKNYCVVLGQLLRREGYTVSTADNAFAALDILAREPISLVLSDLKMPRMDGLALFQKVREDMGDMPFIIMTAFATVQTALESIKNGVYDYLLKPFDNDKVLVTINQALTLYRSQLQIQALQMQVENRYDQEIIGQGPAHQKLMREIALVANAPSPVLITGETGVGKELVARSLHKASPRHHNAWVAVNCAALTETLLDSEIFGHERGAFTGAAQRKKGLAELADGGTLFLDEVGELPLAFQAKLLRLVQEKKFRRVGGTVELSSNIRILAATNRDLATMVQEKTFRQDLFFRLRVVELRVPPLRERAEDIPLLALFFLKRLAKELDRPVQKIAPEAMSCLERYTWPGNIRELRNAIERGILFSSKTILERDALPEEIRYAGENPPDLASRMTMIPPNFSLPAHLERMEQEIISQALIQCHGIQARAAACLGISRSNLQYKLGKLHLE